MVNETIERIARLVQRDDIFIVTNMSQRDAMLSAVRERVPADHVLAEPAARNTTACIGYAAVEIMKRYGDGVMIVTPSDGLSYASSIMSSMDLAVGIRVPSGRR